MSGIAGIIRFDGQEVDRTDLDNMVSLLSHRGQSVIESVDNATFITFGNTPEIDAERQIIAAVDADIFSQTLTNSFINATFQNDFNKLNADFAVAVYNAQTQTITCARDPLGVKPIYYTFSPSRFFAFASEIKALLVLKDVVIRPNYHKFREYLTWPTSYVYYGEETFYESIYSVLPGHAIEVTSQTITSTSYWDLNLTQFASLKTPSDYADTFRELFSEAIDTRMRNKQTVGSQLSGGLDSSSVSSMAQSLLQQQHRPTLHTFNIDPGLASTDESMYVRAVVDKHQTKHHTIRPLADVMASITEITQLFDRPEQFVIPSSFHLSAAQAARQHNCDLVLTGHDGDSVITAGFNYLDELLEQADWETFREANWQYVSQKDRTASFLSPNWNQLSDAEKYQKHILSLVIPNLKKTLKEKSIGNFMSTFQHQKRILGISNVALVKYGQNWLREKWQHRAWTDTILNHDFKQNLTQRNERSTYQLAKKIYDDHHLPVRQLINITNVICNEQLNHIGAYYGHNYSYPFFDRQVIELGLATPLKVRFDQGRGRGLIRNGLQSILPTEVVSRLTKTNFVEYSNLSARQLHEATHELLQISSNPVWDIVDRKSIKTITGFVFSQKIPMERKMRYNWLLSRLVYSAIWFDSISSKK